MKAWVLEEKRKKLWVIGSYGQNGQLDVYPVEEFALEEKARIEKSDLEIGQIRKWRVREVVIKWVCLKT